MKFKRKTLWTILMSLVITVVMSSLTFSVLADNQEQGLSAAVDGSPASSPIDGGGQAPGLSIGLSTPAGASYTISERPNIEPESYGFALPQVSSFMLGDSRPDNVAIGFAKTNSGDEVAQYLADLISGASLTTPLSIPWYGGTTEDISDDFDLWETLYPGAADDFNLSRGGPATAPMTLAEVRAFTAYPAGDFWVGYSAYYATFLTNLQDILDTSSGGAINLGNYGYHTGSILGPAGGIIVMDTTFPYHYEWDAVYSAYVPSRVGGDDFLIDYGNPYFASFLGLISGVKEIKITGTPTLSEKIYSEDDGSDLLSYTYADYFNNNSITPSGDLVIIGDLYPAIFTDLASITDTRITGTVQITGFYNMKDAGGNTLLGGSVDGLANSLARPLDGSGVLYTPNTSSATHIIGGAMDFLTPKGLVVKLGSYGGKIADTSTGTWGRVTRLEITSVSFSRLAAVPTRPDLFNVGTFDFSANNEFVLNIIHDTFAAQISGGVGMIGTGNATYRVPNYMAFSDVAPAPPHSIPLSGKTNIKLPSGITGMIIGGISGTFQGVGFVKSTVEFSGALNLGGSAGKADIVTNIGFSLWAPAAIIRFDNSANLFAARAGYSPVALNGGMHHLLVNDSSMGADNPISGEPAKSAFPDEIVSFTDNLQIGVTMNTTSVDEPIYELAIYGDYLSIPGGGAIHTNMGFGYGDSAAILTDKTLTVAEATALTEVVYTYALTPVTGAAATASIKNLIYSFDVNQKYAGFKYSAAESISVVNATGNVNVYVSSLTDKLEIFKETASPAALTSLKIDGGGEYSANSTSCDLSVIEFKGNYTGDLTEPAYDSPLDPNKFAATGAQSPDTISLEAIATLAGPYDGLAKLTKAPKIINWNLAPSGTANLELDNNIIETIDNAAGLGYSTAKLISIKNNGTEILDLSGVSPNNLESVLFREGNPNLRVLNLSGSTNMKADSIKDVAQDTAGLDVSTLTNLEEVNFNGCIDLAVTAADINYTYNKISSFSLQGIPASGANSIANIDLSGNKLKSIDTSSATATEAVSGAGKVTDLSFAGATEVTGLVNLSGNELTKAWFDGVGFEHLDVQAQVNIPNSTFGTPLPYIKDGIKASNNAGLTDVTFYGMAIGNMIANNSPNFTNLNGTKHHSGTSGIAGIIGGTLDLEGNTSFAATWGNKLNLNGHAIEEANLPAFVLSEINLSYQNAMLEDNYVATQGVLQRVNLAGAQTLALLDVKYNSIEQIDNTGRLRLTGTKAIVLTNTNLAANAVIDADYNNIKIVTLDGPRFATDTLKTLYLEDNLLVDLSLQNMANLSDLFVGRTMADRNLFENGRVILRNSKKITAFAPGTSLAADQALDADYTRATPKEPSERHWGTVDSPGGLRGAVMRNTAVPSGFYTLVPIKELDVRGATGLVTLRVPGNRLTNATMQVDTSASALEIIDISGAPFLANGKASVSSPRTRFNMPVSAIVGKQDPASGNITGTFKGVWPNLKTLYIQNNKLSGFEVGTSTGLEHILAYQNLITNIEVASAASLSVLDIERNLLTNLVVPTGKLRILRAGQNKMFNNPNVSNIPTLEQLYLNHNLLSASLTLNSPNIKVLNLSENRYEIIPNVSKYASLEELYAYGNMAANNLNFSANGALKILDLANNRLTGIPTLPASIVYLDLSDNRFGHILSIAGGLPAGLAQSTDYTGRLAHEVYSRDRANPTEFRGTFAIENNQITKLPDSLKQAFIDMQNNVAGRAIHNIYLDYNILDIDVYNTDPSAVGPDGLVVEFTGTQKWLTAKLNDKAYLQIYAPKEDIYKEVVRSLALYNPARGPLTNASAYEEPFKVQEFDIKMTDPNWTDYISPGTKSIIRQTGVILIDVYIIENLGRNGRCGVPLWLSKEGLIDYNLYGDTGGVGGGTGGTGGDSGTTTGDGNYNPNTGGKPEEN